MKRCFNCMNTYAEEYEVCPHCGYVHSAQPKEAFHLYPGTVLHKRYVVGATVGIGGFGITYRAWDQALDKQVAVKEYFPNGVVNRVPGNPEVIVFSEEATGEFQKGRVRFLAEAENMARFNAHPNIVDVYDFFEENHTAYIVMEFLDGLSFKQYLSLYDGVIPWQKAVEIVNPVLKALKEIHKKKIVHRDISPDNIYILPLDSQLEHFVVKVIDFGAARLSDGEEEKTLSIILKPGFAPPEQYEKKSRQGPWTDFYAVGAMLYLAITGVKPDESLNRMIKDELAGPSELIPDLPRYLNDTIMRALALNPELRFRNADQFLEALNQQARVLTVSQKRLRYRMIRIGAAVGACVLIGGIGLVCSRIYSYRQEMLYHVEADISVQMPDINREKQEDIRKAQKSGKAGEEQLQPRQTSEEMLEGMLQEYGESFRGVEIRQESIRNPGQYGGYLKEQAEKNKLPDVLETTGITRRDSEVWESLGSLEDTFDALDKKDFYFIGDKEFSDCFGKEKKQIPVSFCAPVLYVNTYLIPDPGDLSGITSLERLTLDGHPSYCVGSEDREMYCQAFQAREDDEAFAEDAGGQGYEPFLRREKAYYLGTTDDYEMIQAGLGGIYRMVVLEKLQKEGKVRGRFTHLWSIRDSLTKDERTAADHMVFYLLGERAQDIFNVQNGNGLSLNRNIMEVYVNNNEEFRPVIDQLEDLRMEYGN